MCYVISRVEISTSYYMSHTSEYLCGVMKYFQWTVITTVPYRKVGRKLPD